MYPLLPADLLERGDHTTVYRLVTSMHVHRPFNEVGLSHQGRDGFPAEDQRHGSSSVLVGEVPANPVARCQCLIGRERVEVPVAGLRILATLKVVSQVQ